MHVDWSRSLLTSLSRWSRPRLILAVVPPALVSPRLTLAVISISTQLTLTLVSASPRPHVGSGLSSSRPHAVGLLSLLTSPFRPHLTSALVLSSPRVHTYLVLTSLSPHVGPAVPYLGLTLVSRSAHPHAGPALGPHSHLPHIRYAEDQRSTKVDYMH